MVDLEYDRVTNVREIIVYIHDQCLEPTMIYILISGSLCIRAHEHVKPKPNPKIIIYFIQINKTYYEINTNIV